MTRRWLVSGLLCALGASTGAGAVAAPGETEQAVLAAQDRRIAATIAADLAALEAMMTEDLTYTHSNAATESRAEFLGGLRSGKYRYKSAAFDERRVRLFGDAAAITGTCRIQVVSDGRDVDVKLRFTELYARKNGSWKMALWQSTRVP
jgi:ketosteroid isomerase-like protein